MMEKKELVWKNLYEGSNLTRLYYKDKIMATVNWDVIKQQWYASQGRKGKPQYIFKSLKFRDVEKAKQVVYDVVSKKV